MFWESVRAKSGLKLVKLAGENLPKGMQSLQKRLSESCQDTRHVGRPPELRKKL